MLDVHAPHGSGHGWKDFLIAAILFVATSQASDPYYRRRLARFKILSHLTIEVLSHQS
jgi:hypothetical protein